MSAVGCIVVQPPCRPLPIRFDAGVARLLRLPLPRWCPHSRRELPPGRVPALVDPAIPLFVASRRMCCMRHPPVGPCPGRRSSLHLSLDMSPAVAVCFPQALLSHALTSSPSLFAVPVVCYMPLLLPKSALCHRRDGDVDSYPAASYHRDF